jgi:hypothetical protein
MKSPPVTDDLNRNRLSRAMVSTVEDLSEGPLTKNVDDLIAVCEVIVIHHQVIVTLIIIAMIPRRILHGCLVFLGVCPNAINFRILQDLLLLEWREICGLCAA